MGWTEVHAPDAVWITLDQTKLLVRHFGKGEMPLSRRTSTADITKPKKTIPQSYLVSSISTITDLIATGALAVVSTKAPRSGRGDLVAQPALRLSRHKGVCNVERGSSECVFRAVLGRTLYTQ